MGRLFNQRRKRGVKSTLFIFCSVARIFCETVSIRQNTPKLFIFCSLPAHGGFFHPFCFEPPLNLFPVFCFEVKLAFNWHAFFDARERYFAALLLLKRFINRTNVSKAKLSCLVGKCKGNRNRYISGLPDKNLHDVSIIQRDKHSKRWPIPRSTSFVNRSREGLHRLLAAT